MDPNLQKLAVLAHHGKLETKQKFPLPTIRVYAGGGDHSGFMVSFETYAKYMKELLAIEVEPVPEGEVLFLSMTLHAGPMTCVRTSAVDAWKLPTS